MNERSRPESTHNANVDTTNSAQQRPGRPPIQQTTAAVVAATRPGRIQAAAEGVWTTAVLFGVIGLLTGWLTHDAAVGELLSQVTTQGSEADRREAAGLLHTLSLVSVAAVLLVETALVAFLRRRKVILRLLLSLIALLSGALLPPILSIAMVSGWRGVIIVVGLVTNVLLAVVGSILMWLPAGRPRAAGPRSGPK